MQTTWLKSHLTYVKDLKIKQQPVKFGSHRHCGKDVFILSLDLERPREKGDMWLYEWKPLVVIYHPAKSGAHWHCSIGNKMVFVCHVILQENVT